MHDDELELDESVVRALVDRTLPEYRGRPLRRSGASGSSNALFRLGHDLVVRLPRQPGGSATIEKEARWLPYLDAALAVAVPQVVAVGEPGFGYPERWSVVRWIDGRNPDVGTLDGSAHDVARDLASVVRTLRELTVPADAVHDTQLSWYRSRPLAELDALTRRHLADCRGLRGLDLDIGACTRVWDAAVGLPPAPAGPPRWLHADLLAENLLVRDGRLAGVLDFGGLAVGDPTVDLIAAWEVLGPAARAVFRAAVDVDEPTWLRGRAWALAIAVMTFPYYWRSMPRRCADRLAMARAVLADAA